MSYWEEWMTTHKVYLESGALICAPVVLVLYLGGWDTLGSLMTIVLMATTAAALIWE